MPAFTAPLAPSEPFSAIGDIHGNPRALQALLDGLAARGAPDKVICVGDYIDRGEDSAGVLSLLHGIEAEADGCVICLMGNHERMLLDFLEAEAPAQPGRRWLRVGGLQTLASYRLAPVNETAPAEAWEDLRDRLRAALGAPLETWLRQLPLSWRSGNVAVVHAGADPRLPLEEQPDEVLLWGHAEFLTRPRADGVWVVHGHTIVDEASAQDGRIAIDTGAYATGRLTAAVISDGDVEFHKV